MTKKRLAKSLMAVLLIGASAGVVAETGSLLAHVDEVLISNNTADRDYGGCMAAFYSQPPSGVLGTCPGAWLTFGCTSPHVIDQVQAYRMLDQLQLALATGKKVRVYFRDDIKHNGRCYGYEVRIVR